MALKVGRSSSSSYAVLTLLHVKTTAFFVLENSDSRLVPLKIVPAGILRARIHGAGSHISARLLWRSSFGSSSRLFSHSRTTLSTRENSCASRLSTRAQGSSCVYVTFTSDTSCEEIFFRDAMALRVAHWKSTNTETHPLSSSDSASQKIGPCMLLCKCAKTAFPL